MTRLRVVLDTNVLVSGLAYPESIPGRIIRLWRHGGLEVILSHYILDEAARVLPRLPRIRSSAIDIRTLVDSFMFLASIVEPQEEADVILRDPADQKILGTLLASNAQYLITGDKDLLVHAEIYPIVTPAVFWAKHG